MEKIRASVHDLVSNNTHYVQVINKCYMSSYKIILKENFPFEYKSFAISRTITCTLDHHEISCPFCEVLSHQDVEKHVNFQDAQQHPP